MSSTASPYNLELGQQTSHFSPSMGWGGGRAGKVQSRMQLVWNPIHLLQVPELPSALSPHCFPPRTGTVYRTEGSWVCSACLCWIWPKPETYSSSRT